MLYLQTIRWLIQRTKYITAIAIFSTSLLQAGPTSLFWTNCTTDVMAEKTWHIDVDNYFSVGNRAKNGSSLPTDVGILVGLYSNNYLGIEAGLDYLCGIKDPLLFNTKLSINEAMLFEKAPSLSIGLCNVGTTKARNQQIFDVCVGYTLPQNTGRFFIGAYHGKKALDGARSGWMVGYQKNFDKWQFAADYASGKNSIGGGSVGIAYFFTPKINILTGPIWFNDTKANGVWKWSIQLGIDI